MRGILIEEFLLSSQFGDGGVVCLTDRLVPSPESRSWKLLVRGGNGKVVWLDAWKLNSPWQRTN